MNQETKAALIHKYYAGETTAEEEALLEEHFASTSEQLPADATEAIFKYAMASKAEMPPLALAEKLNAIPFKEQSPYTYLWRIAAALTVVTGALWLIYQFSGFTQTKIEAAERTDALLPDGTHVWLNAGSRLVYQKGIFNNLREITLDGEAYFEVVKDRKHPRFVIHTGEVSTTVTGTAFNLRSIDREDFIELRVLSGTVLFGKTTFKQVTAGMQVLFHKQTGMVTTGPTYSVNPIAWKERKLAFTNAPLSDIIQDMERYFEADIELSNPTAASCHMTGEMLDISLEEALNLIEQLIGGYHCIDNNTYYLNVKPCDE